MFLAWVREGLAPTLQKDDLAIRDTTWPRTGWRGCGRPLKPPAPGFNPIENMWSKIKQRLLSLAPRTGEELLATAKTAFESVSAADCQGFFLHARYAI